MSVLIPAHNHEAFIGSALDSVVAEGYPNLEIVVIDDGSTDGTWRRITTWQGEHATIRVIAEHQANVGLAATLNRMLALASGEFAVPLASDDRLVPGGIEPRVAMLRAHPRLLAVFGDCRVIDERGTLLKERVLGVGRPGSERLGHDPARSIVAGWSVPGPVLVYRRQDIVDIGGYDETLQVEDWDLYLRIAARDGIAYIDQAVGEYRLHGGNTSRRTDRAVAHADDLRRVSWRSRRLYGGHLYLELIHESYSWAARAAWLRRQWLRWAGWKVASAAMKLAATAIPRRRSDQKLADRPQ